MNPTYIPLRSLRVCGLLGPKLSALAARCRSKRKSRSRFCAAVRAAAPIYIHIHTCMHACIPYIDCLYTCTHKLLYSCTCICVHSYLSVYPSNHLCIHSVVLNGDVLWSFSRSSGFRFKVPSSGQTKHLGNGSESKERWGSLSGSLESSPTYAQRTPPRRGQ